VDWLSQSLLKVRYVLKIIGINVDILSFSFQCSSAVSFDSTRINYTDFRIKSQHFYLIFPKKK
ncbi:hypothetical protein, partial [Staphylococcus chromogenes]|uniref:hypothetical protein n=1 Tax=Staphylococcus chromogenes TaxID=46126 RepID=UPI001E60AEF9